MIESHKIWSDFEEISKIYRESGHNQEISNYLKSRLEKAGFEVNQKENDWTICATRGLNKKKNNAIILQAHMDIVAISADGNPKKPIKLCKKEGWLYANDRTLGADDGIGVAAILAIAEDEKFKDYPLEMIITTDEETGMDGAKNLKSDEFQGKYLINLDTEKYGDVIKGCAGISHFKFDEKIKTQKLEDSKYQKITIDIQGARGGHSATITPESLNPIKIILSEIKGKDVKIVKFTGGERYNAIPRDAHIQILVSNDKAEEIITKIKSDLQDLKQKNLEKNPNLTFSVKSENAKAGTKYIDSDFRKKMIDNLEDIPVGLFSKFENSTYSKTSQNLGILKIEDDNFHIQIMGRSADEKEGKDLRDKTAVVLSKLFNKKITVSDTTPIWQPKKDSLLEKIAIEAFDKTSLDREPAAKVEHGGLESGIFTGTKPDLEQISIGPTMEEPHSIQERLKIDTVVPFYNWLCRIIEIINKK